MQFNPNKRTTAKDALRHPYVVQFHNPEDEFECDRTIRIPIDDDTKLTVQDYRERLYNEVLKKKKEQRRSHRRNLEMQQQQQAVTQQQQYAQHPSGAVNNQQDFRAQGYVATQQHQHQSSSQHVRPAPSQGQYGTSGGTGSDYQSHYQGSHAGVHDPYHGHSYAKSNGLYSHQQANAHGSTSPAMAAYAAKKK
jgi:mitogen-activated protein kinase 15